jgi:hypothetical protein
MLKRFSAAQTATYQENEIMSCLSCNPENQAEFVAEVNIHLAGLQNLGNPGILLLPTLLVCLDCGSTQFTIPKNELARLTGSRPVTEA